MGMRPRTPSLPHPDPTPSTRVLWGSTLEQLRSPSPGWGSISGSHFSGTKICPAAYCPRLPGVSRDIQGAWSQHLHGGRGEMGGGSEKLGEGQGSGWTRPLDSHSSQGPAGAHVLAHRELVAAPLSPHPLPWASLEALLNCLQPLRPAPLCSPGVRAPVKGERHLVEKEALAWEFRERRGPVRCPKSQGHCLQRRPGPLHLSP